MKRKLQIITLIVCGLFVLLSIVLFVLVLTSGGGAGEELSITEYVSPNAGKDVSGDVQRAIDENPNRTIYFPDGEYLISKPIRTPASAEKSVSLKLSNYAVIKAYEWVGEVTDEDYNNDWSIEDAMICLGGLDKQNDITKNGSNYFFEGGILDGSGVANGISIDGGRETRVANVSMKGVRVGLHIKYGANYGSSDADITNVNIVGNGALDSIGVLCRGFDNTFTNMRIARVQIGFKLTGGGNMLRNIHPLYSFTEQLNGENYANSIGFYETVGGNVYDYAYSDQFATGFRMHGWGSRFDNCYVFYYADFGKQTGFFCDGAFDGILNQPRVEFKREANDCSFFRTKTHGTGKINSPMFTFERCALGENDWAQYCSEEEIVKI